MKKYSLILIVVVLLLSACGPEWSFTVNSTYAGEFSIDEDTVINFLELKDSDSGCEGIPLEIALYQQGIEVIKNFEIKAEDGQVYQLDDLDLVRPVCVNSDGSMDFNGNHIIPESITINEQEIVQESGNIQDVTATAAHALGLEMENLDGNPLVEGTYDHVVLIFLDGFGYYTYQKILKQNLIPNIIADGAIIPAITVYPPRTTTSSAALLTGLAPNRNGVYKSGIRNTDAETIFDKANEKGLTSVAIEGEALAFNMPGADVVLSGDSDLNGGTDDNTFNNAMETLQNGVPNLVWIHFHGIDDMGHTYGPNTDAVFDKVVEVDRYVGQITEILPENTLIIIFADHGMHSSQEEDESGTHGNLIYADMVIPIIIKTK